MASIIDTTRIVDLPTKSSLSEGDVFVVDNENGATSKIPAAAVSGSSTAGLVAEGYSDAETYDVGEYCIHVEAGIPKLYKCTTAITTAELWTPAHWEGTDAGSEITELNSNLTQLRPDGIGVVTSLTTSAKEGTLIDDAFSNYDMIIIVADDTGDARRASMVLPMASFVASSNNILTFLAGGQTFTMSVKYKTDTKFEAYLSASTSGLGITMQCKVYGMMHK